VRARIWRLSAAGDSEVRSWDRRRSGASLRRVSGVCFVGVEALFVVGVEGPPLLGLVRSKEPVLEESRGVAARCGSRGVDWRAGLGDRVLRSVAGMVLATVGSLRAAGLCDLARRMAAVVSCFFTGERKGLGPPPPPLRDEEKGRGATAGDDDRVRLVGLPEGAEATDPASELASSHKWRLLRVAALRDERLSRDFLSPPCQLAVSKLCRGDEKNVEPFGVFRVDRSAPTSLATATAAATARCVAATLFEQSRCSAPMLSRRRRERTRACDSSR